MILEAFSSVFVWNRWQDVSTKALERLLTAKNSNDDGVQYNEEDGSGVNDSVGQRVPCEPVLAESLTIWELDIRNIEPITSHKPIITQ
jgi:hypothetical protein